MAKFKVGDKFEIEIAEVFKGAESGNDKYRIKGFDNLTFDDKGLGRLAVIADKKANDISRYQYSCKYNGRTFAEPELTEVDNNTQISKEVVRYVKDVEKNCIVIGVWTDSVTKADEMAYKTWAEINYKYLNREEI